MIDGQIDAIPDIDTMFPDRLTYVDLRVWLLALGLIPARYDPGRVQHVLADASGRLQVAALTESR